MMCFNLEDIVLEWASHQKIGIDIGADMDVATFRDMCAATTTNITYKLATHLYDFSAALGVFRVGHNYDRDYYRVFMKPHTVSIRYQHDGCIIIQFLDLICPEDGENFHSVLYLTEYDRRAGDRYDAPVSQYNIYVSENDIEKLIDILYPDLDEDSRAAIKLKYLLST